MNLTSDMLAHGYAPLSSCRDEMTGENASLRPHWQPFLRALDGLGLGELTRRWEEARHLIRENGVTYNIYGDPRGLDRPWQLDPIPLVFPQAEWQSLEAGLIQRARLLERVLADLYGPQRVLHEGLLPPELVLAHPGFLRPCHGLEPVPCQRHLHLYAADLGRSSDGPMCVLGDRTQAPSGAGYALENRIILTRMLPDVFRDCQVQRLALFFRSLRETLRQLAPSQADNPCVVLLTPGPYNETYFEHAFLARYLGYPLVEGADLTVRDNRVFLKLLGGLQPVDVILRRLDDDFCDPLELRGDSSLGVPGLLQAVRAGQVAVANPLGSGVVETPALLPYLPALCRYLLGEELRLPSVPTWWCGEHTAQTHVLANLHRLVIKKAFPSPAREKFFGETAQLSRAGTTRQRHPRLPLELRRPGAARALHGSGLDPRSPGAPPHGIAHVPDGLRRIVPGHARRIDAGLGLGGHAGCLHAERGRQQRHLGARLRPGQYVQLVTSTRPTGGAESCRREICPAGWPTTCSGWDDRPSGPRDWFACSAPCWFA